MRAAAGSLVAPWSAPLACIGLSQRGCHELCSRIRLVAAPGHHGGGALALLAKAGLAAGRPYAQARTPLLRYGLSAWPPNLQPWVSVGASAGTVKMLIHGRLIAYDRDGKLRRRAGRELCARRGRRLGVPAASRTRPSTTAIRSRRPTSSTRSSRSPARNRPPICATSSRTSRASRRRIRAPSASSPRSRSRRCRPGSPTTTCRSCRRSRPRPSSSAAAPTGSTRRSAAPRSSSSPTTSTSSPACRASSASASSSMRTRTCASPRCSPATWT